MAACGWVLGSVAPAVTVIAGHVFAVQHHEDVVGAVQVDGLLVRLATMGALVLVAAFALLRPFVDTASTRVRAVVVVAATVAVVGELAMARADADPRAGVLPMALVTGALAALMVLDPRRGRVSGHLPVMIGVLAVVLGTDLDAAGQLLSGQWSGQALRDSALAWVAALAWFALDGSARPVVSRTARGTSAVVAVAVVAALPGFAATGG